MRIILPGGEVKEMRFSESSIIGYSAVAISIDRQDVLDIARYAAERPNNFQLLMAQLAGRFR